MILEHGFEGTSAVYDAQTKQYRIGQRKQYRWVDHKNKPHSEWYTDISQALEWIKIYDRKSANENSAKP